LRLLIRRLPALLAAWALTVSCVGLALVTAGRFKVLEGIGVAVALMPLALPLLPLLWLQPTWHAEDITMRRAATAVLWAIVAFVPSLFLSIAMLRLFGVT
jgi:hypothetical protein